MAFTRRFLKALDLDEEKIEQIIDAHTEVTNALKEDRDSYKADAEKLPSVQKELDALKASMNEDDPYKAKYEKEHKDFEAFKQEVADKDLKAQKITAYKELLKKAGVADKFTDKIIKTIVLDDIEMDDNGIKDSDKLIESIKKDYDIFLETEGTKGANTETPPSNTGGRMSKDDIFKIKDTAERQKAMLENKDLFI